LTSEFALKHRRWGDRESSAQEERGKEKLNFTWGKHRLELKREKKT